MVLLQQVLPIILFLKPPGAMTSYHSFLLKGSVLHKFRK